MVSVTIDAILHSALARRAVETALVTRKGNPCAANFFYDLLWDIDRLAQLCQLTEFTEHGLPHIGSLVSRIETWERDDGTFVLDSLTNDEAFFLFFAVCVHDIGMLTQTQDDLSEPDRLRYARTFNNLPEWVRRTHVARLEGVVTRRLGPRYPEFVESSYFRLGVELARSHQSWPDEDGYAILASRAEEAGFRPERIAALAGMLAVADLLDEDSSRCDSMTLFSDKVGTLLNRAHWLRHMLTEGPIRIVRGTVNIHLRAPSNLEGRIEGALEGLRNHLRLAQVYNKVLRPLNATIEVDFSGPTYDLEPLPENRDSLALLLLEPEVHLLRTFPRVALPRRIQVEAGAEDTIDCMGVKLLPVDQTILDQAMGPLRNATGRTDVEITYAALRARGSTLRPIIDQMRSVALDAWVRDDWFTMQRLCSLVLSNWHRYDLDEKRASYWAVALTIHSAGRVYELQELQSVLKVFSSSNEVHRDASLPIEWQILRVTTFLLNGSKRVTLDEVTKLIEQWVQNAGTPERLEAQIAWHDLLEALWAKGKFDETTPGYFIDALHRLLDWERKSSETTERLLARLVWRMHRQTPFLRGFDRWEVADQVWESLRFEYEPDSGTQALYELWNAWFTGADYETIVSIARNARMSNPIGTELYVPALQSGWYVAHTDVRALFSNEDYKFLDLELREQTVRDDVSRLIDDIAADLLDLNFQPTDGNTIFLSDRGTGRLAELAVLGERLALRRWDLGAWHRIVGYYARALFALLYQLFVEGEKRVRDFLDGARKLAWGGMYVGNSAKIMHQLFALLEPEIDQITIETTVTAIARGPRRIANLRHPLIRALGDAIPPSVLQKLRSWTIEEIKNGDPLDLAPVCEVWTDVLNHLAMSEDDWRQLLPLFEVALQDVVPSRGSRLLEAVVAQAPWSVTRQVIRVATEHLRAGMAGDSSRSLDLARGTVNGLLRRKDEQWRESEECALLREVLSQVDSGTMDWETFLAPMGDANQDRVVADSWLRFVRELYERVVARQPGDAISFGLTPGLIVTHRCHVPADVAKEATPLLETIWSSERVTVEELRWSAEMAGLLLERTDEDGRQCLMQFFLRALQTQREAIGLFQTTVNGTPIAWNVLGYRSEHIPSRSLSDVTRILKEEMFALPAAAAPGQARLTAEVFLGTDSLQERETMLSLLAVVRATVGGAAIAGGSLRETRYNARTFVWVARRLLMERAPHEQRQLLEFLGTWVGECTKVPSPELRHSVASCARKLYAVSVGETRARFEHALEILRKDVRFRVRSAASRTE